MDELTILDTFVKMWPLLLGFITLVIILAQMYSRIHVLEEKIKVLFRFHNQAQNRRRDDN